jgi:spore maturation protein SpmA
VLATTIGVGGMQAMTEIIQNPALSENQKINFLIITFGISKADALALIKGDEINE